MRILDPYCGDSFFGLETDATCTCARSLRAITSVLTEAACYYMTAVLREDQPDFTLTASVCVCPPPRTLQSLIACGGCVIL